MGILFFDTETTGSPNGRFPLDHPDQPHVCQLGAILLDDDKKVRAEINLIIKPDGWIIPDKVAEIHGITTEIADKYGVSAQDALNMFFNVFGKADIIVAHNISFDMTMSEFLVYLKEFISHIDHYEVRFLFVSVA